jgi:hypothetical protein
LTIQNQDGSARETWEAKPLANNNNHGGKREGSGRPLGSKNKISHAKRLALEAQKEGVTPLEYALEIMRDPNAEPYRRDRMCELAMPFVHPKPLHRGGAAVEGTELFIVNSVQVVSVEAGLNYSGEPFALNAKRPRLVSVPATEQVEIVAIDDGEHEPEAPPPEPPSAA